MHSCVPTHTFHVNYFTHYNTVTLQKSFSKQACMSGNNEYSRLVNFCLEHLQKNANLHETLRICIVNEIMNVSKNILSVPKVTSVSLATNRWPGRLIEVCKGWLSLATESRSRNQKRKTLQSENSVLIPLTNK